MRSLLPKPSRNPKSAPAYGSAVAAACSAVAALAVGLAIHLRDGEYVHDRIGLVSLALISTALVAGAIAVGGGFVNVIRLIRSENALVVLLAAGVALQFAALFTAWPSVDVPFRGGHQLLPFRLGLLASAALIGLIVLRSRLSRALWFPLLLGVHFALSTWTIRSAPSPPIDVWVFQQQGVHAVLHGRNPYAITFPDIYDSTAPGHQRVYGEGLSVNGRLQFGFPYPPVSLLLATGGYLFAGDFRYAQALAMVLAGVFIAASGRGRVAMLAAALLLFTPRVFYLLGRGWSEPFGVLLLAATVFCACRWSRMLPVALGLLLATKQYMILAVPITFFLLPPGWRWRDWFNLLFRSAVVAMVVTLPLALLDLRAFWRSTVTVQQHAPFRWDALSYLVWYGFARARFHALDYPIWFVSRKLTVTDPITAAFWSTGAATAMLALSLWRSARTPAGFAAALGLSSLAFFAFNKQAFCNYYYFSLGAMCCAAGAWGGDPIEKCSTAPA